MLPTLIAAWVLARLAKRQNDADARKSEADRKQAQLATAQSEDPLGLMADSGDAEDGQIFDGILQQAKVGSNVSQSSSIP